MEIDALLSAVSEIGRLTRTPIPAIDLVLPQVSSPARIAGCYPK